MEYRRELNDDRHRRPDPTGQRPARDDRPLVRLRRLAVADAPARAEGRAAHRRATWTASRDPRARPAHHTVLSDGPIGVRGTGEDGLPSAQLPAPSATAATWDDRPAARLGTLIAAEARARPSTSCSRPWSTCSAARSAAGTSSASPRTRSSPARLAVAVRRRASQDAGRRRICVKHFVANETETDRTSYLSRVDERTLREVYLAPFEALVATPASGRSWPPTTASRRRRDAPADRAPARCSPGSSRTSGASTASW